MLTIHYQGWASCRLPTDPDPFDDPRGNLSSFLQLAYAGEPDLDRTIYFNNPPFVRPHCEPVGVTVRRVSNSLGEVAGHALIGAPVDLLDKPALEGRNHVLSEDQDEPIYPFHLRIGAVSRAKQPSAPAFPFPDYKPMPGGVSPSEIAAAAGRSDHLAAWQMRLAALKADLNGAGEAVKPGLEERIAMLEAQAVDGGFFVGRMFNFSMRWRNELNGPVNGDAFALGPAASATLPWIADLWFGAFDADAQCFYCAGTLAVPETGEGPMMARFRRRRA